ncbi:MAG: hypothetical protein HYX29_02085 [Solirubrobacterales bacterium]|nr:hypothetical protein [Solirubrobacterales bacterium]
MSGRGRSAGVAAALVMTALIAGLCVGFTGSAATGKMKQTRSALPSFSTGIDDSGLANGSSAATALARATTLRASYVRIAAAWNAIAPSGATKPSDFDARNPADPNYNWAGTDAQVRRAVDAGFAPYLMLFKAPRWAQDGMAPDSAKAGSGAWKPSAAAFGDFARAAAVRYSGGYSDATTAGNLPRVSIWQAWNEPNLPLFLAPTSAELYRGLLNSMRDSVKAVQPGATIVTAGLAPVKSSQPAAFPKKFAEQLLCVTPANGWFERDPSCTERARFDVLGLHPYSLDARPTQRARIAGNMFVADVEDLAQILQAAQNEKSISPGSKRLWVTEFAWFTTPANSSIGDPPTVAARRTAIALYMFWRAGVSQVTWLALSDNSEAMIRGGGLFDSAGRAKPTYYVLRFPFFVRQQGRGLLVWGKAPAGSTKDVTIKVLRDGAYRRVATIKAASNGVFKRHLTVDSRRAGQYVAEQDGERSPPLGSREYFK